MPQTMDATLKQIARASGERTASQMASRLGLGYISLLDYPFSLEVLSMVPLAEVQQKHLAAYIRSNSKVRIAVVYPEDETTKAAVRDLQKRWQKDVEIVVVSPTSMQYLVSSYIQLLKQKEDAETASALKAQGPGPVNYFETVKNLADLEKFGSQANISELLDIILAAAYNLEASDIHFEPGEAGLLIRFRIDGVLQKVLTLPLEQHHQLVSRLKILAHIKIDNQVIAQDGRFSLVHPGIELDFRVSTIPTHYGEGVVLRLLRRDSKLLGLPELGFSDHNLSLIEKAVRKPYGLILVTGPTGSGKSTTLYALLQLLNSPEKKIITLEDPVEYRLPGIQQSQIDTEKGFTFAQGLKGVLRQDPDIIMVGEIRDPETATIALNASLTGHLVLSTLHTNNAVSAPARFLEMGIPPFLLAGSIQIVIAQRLVRRVVSDSPVGQVQYKGRLTISEVLIPNQEFEQAILQHQDQLTLEQIAKKGGMVPILQDGMDKVKAGLTTEAEVYRVTSV